MFGFVDANISVFSVCTFHVLPCNQVRRIQRARDVFYVIAVSQFDHAIHFVCIRSYTGKRIDCSNVYRLFISVVVRLCIEQIAQVCNQLIGTFFAVCCLCAHFFCCAIRFIKNITYALCPACSRENYFCQFAACTDAVFIIHHKANLFHFQLL